MEPTMERNFKLWILFGLVVSLAVEGLSQAVPSGWTPNYRMRKYAQGANPGADSLNANWTQADSSIRYPGYTIQDSIRSTGNAIRLGSGDGTDTVTVPGLIATATFRMASGASATYVLTADANGNGTWQAATGGGGGAGGWTDYASRVYTTTAGDSVNIRVAAGDTTGGGARFTNWGTTALKALATLHSLSVTNNVTVSGTFTGDTLYVTHISNPAGAVTISDGLEVAGPVSADTLTLGNAGGIDGVLRLLHYEFGPLTDYTTTIVPSTATSAVNLTLPSSSGIFALTTQIPDTNRMAFQDKANTFSQTQTLGGNVAYTANTLLVYPTSSDGADNQRAIIAGGGTAASTRGAYVAVHGNEYASIDSGMVYIQAGAVANSAIHLRGQVEADTVYATTVASNKANVYIGSDGKIKRTTDTTGGSGWNPDTARIAFLDKRASFTKSISTTDSLLDSYVFQQNGTGIAWDDDASAFVGTITGVAELTANRSYALPNAGGTIALTSMIHDSLVASAFKTNATVGNVVTWGAADSLASGPKTEGMTSDTVSTRAYARSVATGSGGDMYRADSTTYYMTLSTVKDSLGDIRTTVNTKLATSAVGSAAYTDSVRVATLDKANAFASGTGQNSFTANNSTGALRVVQSNAANTVALGLYNSAAVPTNIVGLGYYAKPTVTRFARTGITIDDTTTGSEDATLSILLRKAGSEVTALTLTGNTLTAPGEVDLDSVYNSVKGSDNANVFIDANGKLWRTTDTTAAAGGGGAGGWTGYTPRVYTTTAGDSVNIRAAAGDTTGGGALFTNWGTSKFMATASVADSIVVYDKSNNDAASVRFANSAGTIKGNLYTAVDGGLSNWLLPDISGTVALTSQIPDTNRLATLDKNQVFTGTQNGDIPWTTLSRSADTTYSNTTTFVDLGQLEFNMAASGVYEIEAVFFTTRANNANGFTIAFNFSQAVTACGTQGWGINGSAAGTDNIKTEDMRDYLDSLQLTGATVTTLDRGAWVMGIIQNVASVTQFKFRWHTEIVGNVTIGRGSYLRYRRLY